MRLPLAMFPETFKLQLPDEARLFCENKRENVTDTKALDKVAGTVRGSSTSASWREQSVFIFFLPSPSIHPPRSSNHTFFSPMQQDSRCLHFLIGLSLWRLEVVSSAGDLINNQVMYDLPFPQMISAMEHSASRNCEMSAADFSQLRCHFPLKP